MLLFHLIETIGVIIIIIISAVGYPLLDIGIPHDRHLPQLEAACIHRRYFIKTTEKLSRLDSYKEYKVKNGGNPALL